MCGVLSVHFSFVYCYSVYADGKFLFFRLLVLAVKLYVSGVGVDR